MTHKKLTPPPRPPESFADTMSLPASGTVARGGSSDGVVARGSGEIVIGMSCYKCSVQVDPNNSFCPKCGTKISQAGIERDPHAVSCAIEIGTLIGDYRVHRLIGEGGMGRVYLAEHTLLGRKVALKRLRSEFSGNREAVKRFFGEARAVNRIAHENIIEITDFHDDGDAGSYYIMELLEGDTLEEVHERDGVLPLERVIPIAVQVASALKAVHRAGIVHRDLKPENIFLTVDRDGTDFVKLLDFGVAKLTAEDSSISLNSTQQGAILGTPEYMSPEQASGKDIDERSDIYSLGVILFEMVTGGRPFEADNFGELVVKHVTYPIPAPSEWPGRPYAIPVELEQMIMGCLAKQPQDRLGSMSEIELGLRALLEAREFEDAATTALGAVKPWKEPVSTFERAETEVAPELASLAVGPFPALPPRRWPWLVAVAAVLAIATFLLTRGGGEGDAVKEKAQPPTVNEVATPKSSKPDRPERSPAVVPEKKADAAKTEKENVGSPKKVTKATKQTKTSKKTKKARRTKRKARRRTKRGADRKRKRSRQPIDKNAVIDPFDE